ncbi:hypothetical protein ACFVSW_12980 [Neobacillus sp. NPDC058068]|uniref:hypothetical protein n=1 Tax=Neobacillus sp. NPDC058068 TaxID=3346325 RepID=UPI0036D98C02
MKNILLGISSLMLALLIIVLIYFQSSFEPRQHHENQRTDIQDNRKEQTRYTDGTIDYSFQND